MIPDNVMSSINTTFNLIRILSKQKKGLNICHINAQSLCKKIDEFRYLFEGSNMDVIAVSETWFSDKYPDQLVSMKGYNLHRVDRKTHAGGVALYIRNGINFRILNKSPDNSPIEHILGTITFNNKILLVGCIYRPNCQIDFSDLMHTLEISTLNCDDIILAGDFNSNLLIESALSNDMVSLGLTSVNILLPTHFSATNNSLLDLFFVNDKSKILLYDQLSCPIFSRHDLIFLSYDFTLKIEPETYSFRDYKSVVYSDLLRDINMINWNLIYTFTSVDEKVNFLQQYLINLFDKHVPLKTKKVKYSRSPWFNDNIQKLIKCRDISYNRWKKFKTPELYSDFKVNRKKVNKARNISKKLYYKEKFENALSSKNKWKAIKEIGIGKTKNVFSDLIDVCELNQKFVNNSTNNITNSYVNSHLVSPNLPVFSFKRIKETDVVEAILSITSNATGLDQIDPTFVKSILPLILKFITHIFNTIIKFSIFPKNWKLSKIIPVPKGGNDFRPIAILSFLSKTFEVILQKQLNNHLSTHNLLSPQQSGYRANHSCTTAVANVVEDIRLELDKNNYVFLVLLDHSKAFDTVDHNTLCSKLQNLYNVSSSSVSLIKSYLSDRYQVVSVLNKTSQSLLVPSGVPQGSVLGPLLFSLYINDLPRVISHCKIHMYADDVQLYLSCKPENLEYCGNLLNTELSQVKKWAELNGLSLNAKKTKCLLLSRRKIINVSLPKIIIDNIELEYVQTAKNLGFIFSENLSWNNHIYSAVGQTYQMLRVLWTSQWYTPQRIRLLLAKTYLLPKLLYGCEIFHSCDVECFSKLNTLFNNIARYIYGKNRFERISAFSFQIFNMHFKNYLVYRSVIFLHKIVVSKKPTYMYNRIRFFQSIRSNRIIQIKHNYASSERQFFISSIRSWNSLPQKIRKINSVAGFKKELKNYFENL